MAEHTATIAWTRGSDENFLDKRYRRAHTWRFDGGATVTVGAASSVSMWASALSPWKLMKSVIIITLPCTKCWFRPPAAS